MRSGKIHADQRAGSARISRAAYCARITDPDVLIFLDASYPVTTQRGQLNWREADWEEQQRRLLHAREHADCTIQTDGRSPDKVLEEVITFIEDFLANRHSP